MVYGKHLFDHERNEMTRYRTTATWAILLVFAAAIGCGEGKPKATDKKDDSKKASAKKTPTDDNAKKNEGDKKKVSKKPPVKTPPVEKTPQGKVMLGSAELFAGISGEGELTDESIATWLADEKNHELLDFELPLGLSQGAGQEQGIKQNPLTRAKIELGRQLFFDTRLSVNDTISCASCHSPDHGYAAPTQFGEGINGDDGKPQTGNRNSPAAYNRILSGAQFWDGRAGSLEDQAVGPIANPIEMGNTHEKAVATLKAIPGYKAQFDKIFGDVTIDAVGKAIASFERAVVTAPSPFDYYEQFQKYSRFDPEDIEDWKEDDPDQYAAYEEAKKLADANSMSESAVRGKVLFFSEKANCTACHVGPNLSDEKYHNLGVGMDVGKPDAGRFAVTKDKNDTGAFKTPTIRNVGKTAPYMHDGSQKTLEEVVEWYAKGGHPNAQLSDKIKKLDLTDQDKKDLVEFMHSVTGALPKVETGRLPQSGK